MATSKDGDDKGATIVIKRVKKGAHAHHGGAWKIAYADFMTAMMAFFLLMWLLNSVSQSDLQGIADYFKQPLKVSLNQGNTTSDSSSVLQGGGKDFEDPRRGVLRQGERQREIQRDAADRARLQALRSEIDKMLSVKTALSEFKDQIKLDVTDDGLRIQIVDEKDRPMFDSGRADLKPYTQLILAELTSILTKVDNRLSISGHTDSMQYAGSQLKYTNWELSADRANAARRAMVSSGMPVEQILRIEGLADAVPFAGADASSPQNRRISIVVLSKRTEERIRQGGLASSMPFDTESSTEPGTFAVDK